MDNPDVDIFSAQLAPSSLRDEFVPDLLGGIVLIHGKTTDGKSLKFIPYFLWANRGKSQMTVWVDCGYKPWAGKRNGDREPRESI